MKIRHCAWIALFALVLSTTASCNDGGPPALAPGAASSATSSEPPPAKEVAVKLNSKGLREDRDVDYAKPKGRMRIVCLGGSVTFGDGVAREATYEARMQSNMRGRAWDIEVLNAGKPGRGLAESAALLERELLEHDPSLVIDSVEKDDAAKAADRQRTETMAKPKGIVYILLAVPTTWLSTGTPRSRRRSMSCRRRRRSTSSPTRMRCRTRTGA